MHIGILSSHVHDTSKSIADVREFLFVCFFHGDLFVRSVQSALRSKDYFYPDRMRTGIKTFERVLSEHIYLETKEIKELLDRKIRYYCNVKLLFKNVLVK